MMKKFCLNVLPYLLVLAGLVLFFTLKGNYETAAYFVCAALVAAAMILMSVSGYFQSKESVEKQKVLFARLSGDEAFTIVLNLLRTRKLEDVKPEKKAFGLDVYPAGTDCELLKRVATVNASKSDYEKCDKTALGQLELTAPQLKQLSGKTFVISDTDYEMIAKIYTYKRFLSSNTIIIARD